MFALIMVAVTAVTAVVFPAGFITAQAALLVGAVFSGVLLLRLDGRPAGALGFYIKRAGISEAFLGLGLGSAIAFAVVALMVAAGGLSWIAQDGSMFAWFVGSLGALIFLAVPAAAEEALLRGYPLQAIAEVWGPWAAILVTSAIFGGLHLFNPNLTFLGTVNITVAGIFLFFLIFGLSMLLLLLIIAAARLWVAGRVPKIVLVARAHSVSPWTIIQKVIARRRDKSCKF